MGAILLHQFTRRIKVGFLKIMTKILCKQAQIRVIVSCPATYSNILQCVDFISNYAIIRKDAQTVF
jgi:hypothetical protein